MADPTRQATPACSMTLGAPSWRCPAGATGLSMAGAIGLALLFSSGYFVRQARPEVAYFMGSVWQGLGWPVSCALMILAPTIWLVGRGLYGSSLDRRSALMRHAQRQFFGLLLGVGLGGLMAAAGLNIDSIVAMMTPYNAPAETRLPIKAALFVGAAIAGCALVWWSAARGWLRSLLRFASALGLSLGVLTLIECFAWERDATHSPTGARTAAEKLPARRAVWVIFDEFDQQLTRTGSGGRVSDTMPNLASLVLRGVAAVEAYSPADTTVISLPALLMGLAPQRVAYRGPGKLALRMRDQTLVPFGEQGSVFDFSPLRGAPHSILGFYHPYCEVFLGAHRCESPGTTRDTWYAALVHWIPGRLANR